VTLPDILSVCESDGCCLFETRTRSWRDSRVSLMDSDFSRQLALVRIMAPEARRLTSGVSSVTAAVLRTGIYWAHQNLEGRVVALVNFSDSPATYDLLGHGTHIFWHYCGGKKRSGHSRGHMTVF